MDFIKAMGPAWNQMVEVLFRPFQLRKWLALTFVSLIAYGGGGFNVPFSHCREDHDVKNALCSPSPNFIYAQLKDSIRINCSDSTADWRKDTVFDELLQLFFSENWPWIILGFLLLLAVGILIVWVICVLNFVYIDQVARNSGAIREPWARLKHLGTSYFLWQLCFTGVVLVVLGLELGVLIGSGVTFTGDSGRPGPALWGIIGIGVLIFIALAILAVVVQVLTNHFVIATMYVKNIRVLQAWREFWGILRSNAGQVVLYLLMRIGLAIATAIAALFALIPGLIVAAIPGVVVGAIILVLLSLHVSTPVVVITGVILGLPIVFLFVFAVNFVMQPAYVFLRAYPMVMLGQADPALVTIPIGPVHLRPPDEISEQGSQAT